MRRWQWWSLPLLLMANYLFAVARHEGAHALVAVADGGEILEFHLWPPRGFNLAWATVYPTRPRVPWSVPLQAALPHVLSVLLVFGGLLYLGRTARRPYLRLNVALTLLLFPLLDLAISVGAYWLADNDFHLVFGSANQTARIVLSGWVIVLAALAAWVARTAWRSAPPSQARGNPRVRSRADDQDPRSLLP